MCFANVGREIPSLRERILVLMIRFGFSICSSRSCQLGNRCNRRYVEFHVIWRGVRDPKLEEFLQFGLTSQALRKCTTGAQVLGAVLPRGSAPVATTQGCGKDP